MVFTHLFKEKHFPLDHWVKPKCYIKDGQLKQIDSERLKIQGQKYTSQMQIKKARVGIWIIRQLKTQNGKQ